MVSILWWKRRPYLATGWFWYLGMLVPVIGLVQAGEQAMADRYTYLPSIGIACAIVWAVCELIPQGTYWRVLPRRTGLPTSHQTIDAKCFLINGRFATVR